LGIFLKVLLSESVESVAHTCNPSYLGGQVWKDHGSRSDKAGSSLDHISMGKKLGVVVRTCHLNEGMMDVV
jgi:hypothetical protein